MVNYDKWDKLDLGSDDDEPRTRGRPQVTRLEGPSTVTFGGGRGDVVDVRVDAPRPTNEPVRAAKASDKAPVRNTLDASYAKFDALAGDISSDDDINDYYEDEYHAQMDAARRAEFEDTLRNPDGTWKELPPLVRQPGKYIGDMPPPSYPPPDVAEARLMADMDRLAERTEAFTRNGAAENAIESSEKDAAAESEDKGDPAESQQRAGYMWSQEHDECVLSVVVPPGTKAKDVVVECTEDRVKIALANNHASSVATTLVDDDIAHRIDPEPRDDEELERSVDGFDVPRVYGEWEVCDWEPQSLGGRRVVRVTFRKKGLGAMTHWWRRALRSGKEIDTAALKCRKEGKAAESQKIWEEATAAFKESVKNRKPIPIPYTGPSEDSGDDDD